MPSKIFALQLYTAKIPEQFSYFLDKTPRYYLVADSLENVFPTSKHIYLTRNPIAILCSIYNSWVSKDLGGLVNYQVDLVGGLRLLAQKVSSTDHFVSSYEDLLQNPEQVFDRLIAYTGLEIPEAPLGYNYDENSKLGGG